MSRERYKPRIYLHKYANGLKFWRVIPLSERADGLRYKHMTRNERDRHEAAYEFVSYLNRTSFGKAGYYAS